MDGHFVPNLSYGAPVIADWRKRTDFPFDTHLMISDPGRYLDDFVQAGCDVIIFHIEAVPEPVALLRRIRGAGLPGGAGPEPADAALGDRAVPGRGRRGAGHERDAGLRRPGVRAVGAREGPRAPGGPARRCGSRSTAGSSPTTAAEAVAAGARNWSPARRSSATMATTRRPWPSWPRAPAAASERGGGPAPPAGPPSQE